MNCYFCGANDNVQQKANWQVCRTCTQLSKKCSKGEGLYYHVLNRQYVAGDQPDLSVGKLLVLDLHNVTDQVPPAELDAVLAETKVDKVVVLSFVGTTTDTRVEADTQIREIVAAIKSKPIDGYLCFKRGDHVRPGNKGGFIAASGASQVYFLDDSSDHIAAGTAAGAMCTQIPNPTEADSKAAVLETLKLL